MKHYIPCTLGSNLHDPPSLEHSDTILHSWIVQKLFKRDILENRKREQVTKLIYSCCSPQMTDTWFLVISGSWYTVRKIASYNLYRYGLPRTCCIYTEYNLQIVFCIDADSNLSMQILVCIYICKLYTVSMQTGVSQQIAFCIYADSILHMNTNATGRPVARFWSKFWFN